jgi:C1A family cysteine protease
MTSQKHDNSDIGMRRRMPSRHGGFGWQRDLPDARDFMYSAPMPHLAKMPAHVDLRAQCPAVYDQGQLGSCTANGIGAAVEFDQRKQKKTEYVPSRLFIYYNERAIEGTVNQDSGAQIRDGIKVVAQLGAPPESMLPYDISKFTQKPSAAVYAEAKKDLVKVYARVQQVQSQMMGCLADGYPFVFGFTVYESFESDQVAKTGIVPMPSPGEQVLGGHCVVAVGYDTKTRQFLIRNSWGVNWGQAGYCMMPFEYLLNSQYSSDFWTIRTV